MQKSAKKGNLANSAIVLENGVLVAAAESWVVSSCDASAHSERMLVEQVGKLKNSNWTPNLTMVSVVEPCLMCMSACSQAGYKDIFYIIPADKYIKSIPYMSDVKGINKNEIARKFISPIELKHLSKYENEFSVIFEKAMKRRLN